MPNLRSLYPVIATKELQASRDFYIKMLGLTPTFEADWYLSLVHPQNSMLQLAFVDYEHPSVPAAFRRVSQGGLLNFELEEVDQYYAQFCQAAVPIALELRSEPWGQRHFIAIDPNGLLVDLIQLIPPSPEYAAQYSPAALQMLNSVAP